MNTCRLSTWPPLGNLLPNCNYEQSHTAALVQKEYEYPSRMGVWIQPPGELPVPAKVKAEDEGDLEWIVEVGKDEYRFWL